MLRVVMLMVLVMLGSTVAAADVSGPAADFTLKSRSGENIKLSDLRGDVVMINFWASWCGPCRQEMPHLEVLSKEYADYGFTLLGVNVDEKQELAEKLLAQIPVSFPILFDPTSSVSKLYNVDAMPTTILIDRDGNLRHLHRAYRPGFEDIYSDQIKALVLE
ncbi:MAG: TlpA disulfide reductase family protein [Alcanivoracaceae bacterium]|nr:TlpA disulfide reductase family protein [Alcanivoracaceae bacterium]